MRTRSFWLGAGLAGVVWLWRRQLRPLAVKGVKGGLIVVDGIKDNMQAVRDVFFDLKQDAQMDRIRQDVKSAGNKTTGTEEENGEDL